MGSLLGLEPVGVHGEIEIQVTYGGLVIASALLMFSGLFNRFFAVAALVAMIIQAGGVMITRLVVQLIDGFTNIQTLGAAIEFGLSGIALFLLKAAINRARNATHDGGALNVDNLPGFLRLTP